MLVVGVGARPGVGEDELDAAIDRALAAANRRRSEVAALATVDRRADSVRPFAESRGWELVVFTAAELAGVDVPRPSDRVRDRVGTPSVAEAAAILAGDRLIAAKRVFPRVTVAIAERVPV